MAKTIRLIAAGTEDTHDLCLNEKRRLFEVTGIDAYAQIVNCKMRTMLGEKQLNINDGIPYFQTVFSDSSTVAIWEAEVRDMLESLPFVVQVIYLETSVDNGVLTYKTIIETDLGDRTFTGTVNEKQVRDSIKISLKDQVSSNVTIIGGPKADVVEEVSKMIIFATAENMTHIAPIVALPGTSITLKKAYKIDYEFDGWYLDENFTNKFKSTVMPNESIILYPKFIDSKEYTIFDASIAGNKSKNYTFELVLWAHNDDGIVKVDWGDGIVSSYMCPISHAQEENISTGKHVSHKYQVPSIYRIKIDGGCFKFRVGFKDTAESADKKPDFSQSSVYRLLHWGSKIKNTYRTFSYCRNLYAEIPPWPENIGILEEGSSARGVGCVGATFERTNISNFVSWIYGITVARYCYCECRNITDEIPELIDFGSGKSLADARNLFDGCSYIRPTPKLVNETDEEYAARIMPSFVTRKNYYVHNTNPQVEDLYTLEWKLI